ncbi:hypothetical protein PHLGIDRAFT_15116 [Phlebiopsis gigantea 11061_1 CR5-6]|uniref:F-box domain-containing protein n=1 Tax=Phlebiopsis gigantea (strain 11061_1 CR5-6) TaxID=745531 RepID=A0A0C3PFW3_PHLG1|nr:hypothetical protein PHLGIDRAFT_15116 [Phlebiopsis gigantea 11061_1 CR5-6]
MAGLPPPLPVELIDMIIECLHPRDFRSVTGHYAQRNMSSCALVSRSWSSIVQPHLFREIDYSFCVPDPSGDAKSETTSTLPMLHTFLAGFPAVARHIRKLRLRQIIQGEGEECPTVAKILYAEFLALLDVMPHLQELYLHDFAVFRPADVLIHPNSRSLEKLHIAYSSVLGYTTSSSDVNLKAQIACARQIDQLVLSNIDELDFYDDDPDDSVDQIMSPDQLALAEPPVVRCVVFDTGLDIDCLRGEGAILQFLGTWVQLDAISHLTLEDYSGFQNPTLMFKLGPQLERLQLLITELVLVLVIADDHDYTSDQLEVLGRMLEASQITRGRYPKLSSLVLEIDLEIDWGSGEDWVPNVREFDAEEVDEEVDALLVSIVNNTAVPTITIQWAESQTYVGPECEACIRSMFPMLSANDMIVFRDRD